MTISSAPTKTPTPATPHHHHTEAHKRGPPLAKKAVTGEYIHEKAVAPELLLLDVANNDHSVRFDIENTAAGQVEHSKQQIREHEINEERHHLHPMPEKEHHDCESTNLKQRIRDLQDDGLVCGAKDTDNRVIVHFA